jgi:hypothetical protein
VCYSLFIAALFVVTLLVFGKAGCYLQVVYCIFLGGLVCIRLDYWLGSSSCSPGAPRP